MKVRKTVGIVICLVGVAMLFASMYIENRVAEGREQIEEAQREVNRGRSLFSLNPLAEEIGKGITGSAQKKINAYSQEADSYEILAGRLKIGGIVLAVLGLAIFLLSL